MIMMIIHALLLSFIGLAAIKVWIWCTLSLSKKIWSISEMSKGGKQQDIQTMEENVKMPLE